MDGHENERKSTRRTFLASTGVLAAGWPLAGRDGGGARERLALCGGAPAVTIPPDRQADAFRWPLYGADEEKAVIELLHSPSYRPIALFEGEWKAYTGSPFVKAHMNGTSALASMFFGLDLPPGSEIMVPSYTFFATIVPMRLFGLVPVFVDIHPRTLNLDVEDAKRRLTKDAKAILPVHWLGLPCDMDAIGEFAKEKGLILLEDAAHAHGATYRGRKMGTIGRMGIYSYQASKPLPCIEGGMGMYKERADYERATTFGNYDFPGGFPEGSSYRKFQGTGLGLKFRMHPMAAAIARCQLRGLDARNALATAQIRRLNDRICKLPGLYEQAPQPNAERVHYAWNMLFIDEAKAGMSRDGCVKALKAEGVQANAGSYPLQHKGALYREDAWWHHKPAIPELPGSEQANATSLSLPVFTSDVPDLVEQYAKAFEKVWAQRREIGRV